MKRRKTRNLKSLRLSKSKRLNIRKSRLRSHKSRRRSHKSRRRSHKSNVDGAPDPELIKGKQCMLTESQEQDFHKLFDNDHKECEFSTITIMNNLLDSKTLQNVVIKKDDLKYIYQDHPEEFFFSHNIVEYKIKTT
jgi:hypothetical protein